MPKADIVEEYVAALQARDWPRMGRTLSADIRREGAEGAETDSIEGRDVYLQWSADLLDPLHKFTWTPLRFTSTEILWRLPSRSWVSGSKPSR